MDRLTTVLATLLLVGVSVAETNLLGGSRPRLGVVIVIDQLRADYLERFEPHFLPPTGPQGVGGFRFLMEDGAWFANAAFSHFQTLTCPGHAAISTGAPPGVSGVIGNEWYDRELGRYVNCTADPASIKAGKEMRTPGTMRAPTVGDELKLATGGRARVVGLSFKDYAALSMSGKTADLVLWYEESDGTMESNQYFLGEKALPDWVASFNAERIPDRFAGTNWERLLPEEAYSETFDEHPEANPQTSPYDYGWSFPHHLGQPGTKESQFYRAFEASGLAPEFLAEAARRAVAGEALGRDEIPDLLLVSFSSTDRVGHVFGPDSPETLDVFVRTDRALAGLFRFLIREIGEENLVIALTSDHGIQELPSRLAARGISAGRVERDSLASAVEAELTRVFGSASRWVLAATDQDLYLNRDEISGHGLDPAQVEGVAARALMGVEGIRLALTRTQILKGEIPGSLSRPVSDSFDPERSGDVVLVYQPNWFRKGSVLTHHGPYYASQREVPVLVWGRGVSPGKFYRSVDPADLAPTMSRLLGAPPPAASQGQLLREIFEPAKP